MPEKETHPRLYVIAGPNGAGKTTFAKEFLPGFAHCKEFVNADLIAGGLSPFSPMTAAIRAGRLMLKRINELAHQKQSFAFETTLSGKGYLSLFRRLKKRGYRIHLIYLWLPSKELAIQRVQERVRRGGHSVLDEDIRRRFSRGLRNLFYGYRSLVNTWTLVDNSEQWPRTVAYEIEGRGHIRDSDLFSKIEEDVKKYEKET